MFHASKERTMCITTGFPYHWIPKKVIIHTIYGVCMWLNEFLPTTKLIGGAIPKGVGHMKESSL